MSTETQKGVSIKDIFIPPRRPIKNGSSKTFISPYVVAAIEAMYINHNESEYYINFDREMANDGDEAFKTKYRSTQPYCKKLPKEFAKLKGKDISYIWSKYGVALCDGKEHMARRVYREFLMFFEAFDQEFSFGSLVAPSVVNKISTTLGKNDSNPDAPIHRFTERAATTQIYKDLMDEIRKQRQHQFLIDRFFVFEKAHEDYAHQGIYALKDHQFNPDISFSTRKYSKPVKVAIHRANRIDDSTLYELLIVNPQVSREKIYKELSDNFEVTKDFRKQGSDMFVQIDGYENALQAAQFVVETFFTHEDIRQSVTREEKEQPSFRRLGSNFVETLRFKSSKGLQRICQFLKRRLA